MKKIILIPLIILAFSCGNDDTNCTIEAQRVYTSTRVLDLNRDLGENLLITNDTILEGNQLWRAVINNNSYNVTVTGNLVATSTVIQDGGVLEVTGNLTVGNALRFFEGNGIVDVEGNVIVGNTVAGIGTIEHCGFFDPPLDTESTIIIEQDCETLSIGSVSGVGKIENVACDYFETTDLLQDEIGTYYYKKI